MRRVAAKAVVAIVYYDAAMVAFPLRDRTIGHNPCGTVSQFFADSSRSAPDNAIPIDKALSDPWPALVRAPFINLTP
jgi:hypothetical protein